MSFRSLSRNSYYHQGKDKSDASGEDRSGGSDVVAAYKLVMVGDSGVGKSCLLEKFLDHSSDNSFISTIGVDVRTNVCNMDGQNVKLQVWDTGGQQRYRPVLSSCYRNAAGVIVVFDVTNEKSFVNLNQWMSEIAEFGRSETPKLLIGNKSDLGDRREVVAERAEEFASSNSMTYIETSAMTMDNIREAFLALVKRDLSSKAAAT